MVDTIHIALRQNNRVKCYNNTSDWKVFSKGMNFRGEWGDDRPHKII